MSRMPWGRIALIVFVLAVCGLLLATKPILFGLDLQGGSHLLIKVHADEAVEQEINDAYAAIKNALEEKDIPFSDDVISIVLDETDPNYKKRLKDIDGQPPYVQFTITDAGKLEEARQLVRDRVVGNSGHWNMGGEGNIIRVTLPALSIKNVRAATVENVRRAIEHRIDQLGVAEPSIVIPGNPAVDERILLQLPGVEDPEEAKRRIQTPGQLEMRLVVYDDKGVPYSATTKEELLEKLGGKVPTGTEMVPEYRREDRSKKNTTRIPSTWWLIYNEAKVNSNYLIGAEKYIHPQTNKIGVSFRLNPEGGERMRQITRPNVGKLLSTVLDDEAIVVANIDSEIGVEGTISGNYTHESANELAFLLRTGAIPTSMHVEEERSPGPALGADSIRMGVEAFIWGLGIVALFMMIYYKFSGVLSVIVLTINIFLIMSFLAMFGAVLTLPGIAGIILTIGMSVDANVIIFERIREERAVGRSVLGSVESGFGKAFGTIFDANITTLIAAIFLFQFGTGPLKGFATTITIGILASMFTAVFVARTIYDTVFAMKKNKIEKLSI